MVRWSLTSMQWSPIANLDPTCGESNRSRGANQRKIRACARNPAGHGRSRTPARGAPGPGPREDVKGRPCNLRAAKRRRGTAMAARSGGLQISKARGGIVPIVTSERAFKGRFRSLGVAHRELASARRPPRRWKIGPNLAVTHIPLRPTRSGSPTPQALRAIVTPYLKQCYEKRILFRRLA